MRAANRPRRVAGRRSEGWGFTGLRNAFALLTALPVPAPATRTASERPPARPGAALAFFPLVGLVVGGLQAAAFEAAARAFGPSLAALMPLAAGFLATRGLHWDGWLDCCDALLGAHPRQRRLAILRDSRVGAFAVVGGIWMALAQWLAVAQVPRPAVAIVLAATLSRWAMAVAVVAFPAARPEGLGAWMHGGSTRRQAAVATGLTAAAAAALGGLAGIGTMVLVGVVAAAFAAWASRLLGGLTGDVYGAVQVLAETATLWICVATAAGAGPPGR